MKSESYDSHIDGSILRELNDDVVCLWGGGIKKETSLRSLFVADSRIELLFDA